MAKGNKAFGGKAKSGADIMTAQSKYEVDIISRAFGIPREIYHLRTASERSFGSCKP